MTAGVANDTIVVTRPGATGCELAAELCSSADALWWPAFDFQPMSDPAAARAVDATIDRYDLAIVVSPAAARFGAGVLPHLARVPVFAAVGEGTREALQRELALPPERVLAPPAGAGGVEALLPLLVPHLAPHPASWRRALILRAPQGRDWLAPRLVAAGLAVTELAVYRREASVPDPASAAALGARARAGGRGVLVVTSSAAVPVLEAHFAPLAGVAEWLHRGVTLASHPRIADALRAAGYPRVTCCESTAGSILAALRE
jgi:uroporphyrinogen-III synthase